MDTSIYIANRDLRIVSGTASSGSISVKHYAKMTLPEGAVINGVVTDEKEFVNAFKYLMKKNTSISYKNVRLTLGSSQIFVKKSVVPDMSDKNLNEWMKDEFSDMGTEEELIYDYTVLDRTESGTTVLLCAVKKELIGGYVELFGSLGVTISCIDTSRDSQIKFMKLFDSLKKETYITLALDGNSLEATLFIDGVFCIANKTRLLEQRGTQESFSEIGRMASSLMQFNSAERSGRNISRIVFLGDVEEEGELGASLAQTFGIEAKLLTDDKKRVKVSADFDVAGYAYALGNLMKV